MTTVVFDTVAYPDLAHVHDRSGARPAIADLRVFTF